MSTFPDVQRDRALTPAEVHQFLASPVFVARELQDIMDLSFLSDFLLRGSANATGSGAVLVEEDESLFADSASEEIAPGGEYPLVAASEVAAALVALRKRGADSELTDERIARSPRDELRRKLQRLANTIVRDFDAFTAGVVASKVTQTHTGAAWTSGSAIIDNVLMAAAKVEELELGYTPNTVVLKPTHYAKASAVLISANVLPREAGNPLLSGGNSFDYMNMTWVKSMYSPFSDPFVVDTENLGGIASENIGSPGYARTERGIEVKTWRPTGRDDNDSWLLRARRVAVPYVSAPKAGIRITGHGL